jgi:hypothetical protein
MPPKGLILMICKIPELLKKTPLLKAEKHPDFRVTLCGQNDTTNVDFAYL